MPFFPLITDMEVFKAAARSTSGIRQESFYAMVPRRGERASTLVRGPAVSAGHMMNAFTEGNTVNLDLCLYKGNCFDFFPSRDGSPFRPSPPLLTRMSFDLGAER